MTGWMWDALMVFAYAGFAVAFWKIGYDYGYRRGKAEADIAALRLEVQATDQRFQRWQARHAAERRDEDEERDDDF